MISQTEQIINMGIEFVSKNKIDDRSTNLLQGLLELRTLTINLGRRAGHTSYIKKHATRSDLIIVPSLHIARYCYGDLPQGFKIIPIDYFSQSEKTFSRVRGCRFNTIWIDKSGMKCGLEDLMVGLLISGCLTNNTMVVCLG